MSAPARLTALAEACADLCQPQTHPVVIRQHIETAITTALAEAEPGSDRLLAALWRLAWRTGGGR